MRGQDSLERKAQENRDVLSQNYNLRKAGHASAEQLGNMQPTAAANDSTAVLSRKDGVSPTEPVSGEGYYCNNGYVQKEILLNAVLPEDSETVVADTNVDNGSQNSKRVKNSKHEVILQAKALDDLDTSEESEVAAPLKQSIQNGVRRAAPRRTASFPMQHRSRRRADSSTSSKWTAVKHAVKITHTMARHQKTKQDSFMEK